MIARINDVDYHIQWSYARREGKRHRLARNAPVPGVTACAICWIGDAGRIVSALGQSVCSAADNWNRAEGRAWAFEDAVHRCGLLRGDISMGLDRWFAQRFPRHAPPAKRVTVRLSDADIAWRKEEGRARKAQAALAEGGQ
jgi:hypothetical protein